MQEVTGGDSKASFALSSSSSLEANWFREPEAVVSLVVDMALSNQLVFLVAIEPVELGGHGYGLCLINAVRLSRKGVLPFDGAENEVGARSLEGADVRCWAAIF